MKEYVFLEEIFQQDVENRFFDQTIFGDEVEDARENYSSLREATEDLYFNILPEMYEQNDEQAELLFTINDLYNYLMADWEEPIRRKGILSPIVNFGRKLIHTIKHHIPESNRPEMYQTV